MTEPNRTNTNKGLLVLSILLLLGGLAVAGIGFVLWLASDSNGHSGVGGGLAGLGKGMGGVGMIAGGLMFVGGIVLLARA